MNARRIAGETTNVSSPKSGTGTGKIGSNQTRTSGMVLFSTCVARSPTIVSFSNHSMPSRTRSPAAISGTSHLPPLKGLMRVLVVVAEDEIGAAEAPVEDDVGGGM